MKKYDKDDCTIDVYPDVEKYNNISDDLKKPTPFELTVQVKPEFKPWLKDLKVGAPFEMDYRVYHIEGKVTKTDGDKLTIKGTQPVIQALNMLTDDIDLMKYC